MGVIITILTGSRPELLKRTLQSLFEVMPELRSQHILALANGNDQPTIDVLEKFDVSYKTTAKLLPIGEAISLLADWVLKSGMKYWLSLEDDWQAVSSGVSKAVWILDRFPDISQVRLRHTSEWVMPKHMITGVPINWHRRNGFLYATAHRTLNPNLARVEDIPKCFPCTGERHMQKRALKNGLTTIAQLEPGIFKHIGAENSLREVTKCEL